MSYPHKRAHGVMFHHFHDGRKHCAGQGSITQQDLQDVLDFVGRDRIVSPEQWMQRFASGALNDEICITLDDSLLCQFDIALPVLERNGITAFWFVYSDVFEGALNKFELYRSFRSQCFEDIDDFYRQFFAKVEDSEFAGKARTAIATDEVDRYRAAYPFYSRNDVRFRFVRDKALGKSEYEKLMDNMIAESGVKSEELGKNTWMSNEHLRYLAGGGHAIGLHSYSHPTAIAALSKQEQRSEYQRNFDHIARVTGQTPTAMAHPVNSYNADTVEVLEGLGIRCGFRSNMTQTDGNPYEMPREDHANIKCMTGERTLSQ